MLLMVIDQGGGIFDRLAHRLRLAGFMLAAVGTAAEIPASPLRASTQAILIDQGREAPCTAGTVAELRAAGLTQPVLVLAARDDWRERVAALDAGANDILLKPVHSEEVAARLRAAVRSNAGKAASRMTFGDIEFDMKARCAWRAGKCLALTRNEFRLLQNLLLANGGFLTKQQISEALWPGDRNVTSNAIEVLCNRLRAKLGPDRILTLRGMGYRLALPDMTDGLPPEPGPCKNC
ncbi:winged helix-turn-helix domain-containing protein [Novosphingobium bradum]|uniref:Winged helix-turn-helix domain-containing protein n=1 Tax=Novosphingobium bradum TaxID=1737444 RepID=A0ABV7IRS9_9SPHN